MSQGDMSFFPFLFPLLIIVLSVGAGIVYLCYKSPLHAVYWFAAAILNASVLMMGEWGG